MVLELVSVQESAATMKLGFSAMASTAFLVASGSGFAQSSQQPSPSAAFNADRVITGATQQDLAGLIRHRGDTLISERKHGDVSVIAKSQTGLTYIISGAACGTPTQGCRGLIFEIRYEIISPLNYQNINRANLQFPLVKTLGATSNSGANIILVSHYTILDGGQKLRNLSFIASNFLATAPKAFKIANPT